jgi:hypothetical protein
LRKKVWLDHYRFDGLIFEHQPGEEPGLPPNQQLEMEKELLKEQKRAQQIADDSAEELMSLAKAHAEEIRRLAELRVTSLINKAETEAKELRESREKLLKQMSTEARKREEELRILKTMVARKEEQLRKAKFNVDKSAYAKELAEDVSIQMVEEAQASSKRIKKLAKASSQLVLDAGQGTALDHARDIESNAEGHQREEVIEKEKAIEEGTWSDPVRPVVESLGVEEEAMMTSRAWKGSEQNRLKEIQYKKIRDREKVEAIRRREEALMKRKVIVRPPKMGDQASKVIWKKAEEVEGNTIGSHQDGFSDRLDPRQRIDGLHDFLVVPQVDGSYEKSPHRDKSRTQASTSSYIETVQKEKTSKVKAKTKQLWTEVLDLFRPSAASDEVEQKAKDKPIEKRPENEINRYWMQKGLLKMDGLKRFTVMPDFFKRVMKNKMVAKPTSSLPKATEAPKPAPKKSPSRVKIPLFIRKEDGEPVVPVNPQTPVREKRIEEMEGKKKKPLNFKKWFSRREPSKTRMNSTEDPQLPLFIEDHSTVKILEVSTLKSSRVMIQKPTPVKAKIKSPRIGAPLLKWFFPSQGKAVKEQSVQKSVHVIQRTELKPVIQHTDLKPIIKDTELSPTDMKEKGPMQSMRGRRESKGSLRVRPVMIFSPEEPLAGKRRARR